MKTKSSDELVELINRAPSHPPSFEAKRVVIYGAGQMGVAAADFLKKAGIGIECFLDRNPAMKGKIINGIQVLHPDALREEQKEECLFAIGVIKISFNGIVDYLRDLGCRKICYVGHVIEQVYKKASIAYTWYFDNMRDDERKLIVETFESFSDEISRCAYFQILSWIISNTEVELCPVSSPDEKYFIPEVLNVLTRREVFIDCGAYDGSSISRIEKLTAGNYNELHSFEPDPENHKLLMQAHGDNKKVRIYNFGLGSEDRERNFAAGLGLSSRYTENEAGTLIPMKRLDNIMEGKPYSFMKVYGSGIGREVIEGALKTLREFRPVIAINIHHTKQDFLKIPVLLAENMKNYDFKLRLHGYCGGEAVLYAIPGERYDNIPQK